eukprot:m.83846 g.83846  ORF g.83846 m.83846 type:complete len:299 (+) comp11248_c0_seq1:145-1041(+)
MLRVHDLTGRDKDFLCKVLMIGDSCAGKSSLLLRMSDDTFTDRFISTIGVDFRVRTVRHSGLSVMLQIWDTAGHERFRTITSSYYRGAHVVMILYDTTDPESLAGIPGWLKEIDRYATEGVKKILVGTKTDGVRMINRDEAEALARSLGIPHVETSAKTDTNVKGAFMAAVAPLLDKLVIERGPWKYTHHGRTAADTKEVVTTLLLCAQRSADIYALDDTLYPVNPPPAGLLDVLPTQWVPVALSGLVSIQNTPRHTLALPKLPWEMWFAILGMLNAAELRKFGRPTDSQSSFWKWLR